jgi:hypothetical protein
MKRREHSLQIAVAHMLQLVLDPVYTWWSAIDHGVGKLGPAESGIRKRRGVKPGLPDFIILKERNETYASLIGIELKVDKGKLSPSQEEVQFAWIGLGQRHYVARSLEDVQTILELCHVPVRRRMTFVGDAHEPRQRSQTTRHSGPRRRRKSKNHLPLVLPSAPQKD